MNHNELFSRSVLLRSSFDLHCNAIALTLDWGDGSIIERAMMDEEGENRRPDREALEKINQVLNFSIYSGASDL